MRVLLIDDDLVHARSLELRLRTEGIELFTFDCGEDGVVMAGDRDFDLILLDLCLPDISGFEVLRRIRGRRITTPALILTAEFSVDSKVKALGLGADDYLTKPVDFYELLARMRAVYRRSLGHAAMTAEFGDLVVDFDNRRASVSGVPVNLTYSEYRILEVLALRPGLTITKAMILDHLYAGRDEPEMKIVDVYVCKLRKKLQKANTTAWIETVWGRGYVLRRPKAEAAAA